MNDSIRCAFCGKALDLATIIRERHYSAAQIQAHGPYHCDRECDMARRKRDGFFKQMSVKGREARSKAVAKSNVVNPRRKAK
jgi:hypothetical protein